MAIADYAELRTVYKEPGPRAAQKVLNYLDKHSANFIALSPLCVIATANADGRADASPRGGAARLRQADGRVHAYAAGSSG